MMRRRPSQVSDFSHGIFSAPNSIRASVKTTCNASVVRRRCGAQEMLPAASVDAATMMLAGTRNIGKPVANEWATATRPGVIAK
jgi:hypothetical protein